MSSWKKIIIGEPIPDRDDPRYQKRHEAAAAAGEKFALFLRLDKAGAFLQDYGQRHTKRFFAICFVFLITLFLLCNGSRIGQGITHRHSDAGISNVVHQSKK